MIISDKQAEILRQTRTLWDDLRQLRADLAGKRRGDLSSSWSDGSPRGGGDADKETARLIKIDQMEKRKVFLEHSIKEARMSAHHVCLGIKTSAKARLFFEAYCVDLVPLEVAQKISGADDQTVRQYLQLLGEEEQ